MKFINFLKQKGIDLNYNSKETDPILNLSSNETNINNQLPIIEKTSSQISISEIREKDPFVIQEKIKIEKQRRNQIYVTLNYFLSLYTYFDFFTPDCIEIVEKAHELAYYANKERVSSKLILLSFFSKENLLRPILKKAGITPKRIEKYLQKKQENNSLSEKILKLLNIDFFLFFFKKVFDKNEYPFRPFGNKVNLLFENAANTALTKFKTPVVTSEILFITLMEQKETRVGKFIKRSLKNELNWYLLRYKLIKRIHSQESAVRYSVSENQRYFAYLLKRSISESYFAKLVQDSLLDQNVSAFRNLLISHVLSLNIYDYLWVDIHRSMKLCSLKRARKKKK